MSDSIKNTLPLPAPEKSPLDRGAGQRQQWRLIFEKAYLALSRKDAAPMQAATSGIAGAEAGSNGRHSVMQTTQAVKPGIEAGAGAATAIYEYGGDAIDFASEVTGGRLERRVAELLNGPGMPSAAQRKEPAVSTALPMREAAQVWSYKHTLRDKSLLLLPMEDGVQLVIRDASIGTGLLNRMIQTVRDILDGRGIRLARVVVNGAELWNEKANDKDAAGSAEFSADLINRIY
jgi:hypothetical protein